MLSAKDTLALIDTLKAQAIAHPGKAVRVRAGYYFLAISAKALTTIERMEEGSCKDLWIVRDWDGRWYHDPVFYLADAITQALASHS